MLGLEPFFEPRRIAVFGASADKMLFANLALRNLRNHGCAVPVHVIHPSAREIDGLSCVPSLSALSEAPDLAIIGVRADRSPAALAECAAAGVRAATIVAAGFAEVGSAEGLALQAEIDAIRQRSGMRIIGPNTLGVASFATHAVSIASGNIPATMPRGPVALVTQSGGVALSIMLRGLVKDLGFSQLVAVGNECDVSLAEVVELLAARDEVGIVACYVEGVRDIARLRRAVAACTARRKPVIFLKGGQTRAGQRATASHTGSLAGSGPVWRSVMAQIGAIHAESVDHLIALAILFARHGATSARNLGTFCVGGGLTVLFTDMLARAGIVSPPLSDATSAIIKEALPDVTPANPCDLGGLYLSGDGSVLKTAVQAMANDPAVDALAIGYCPVITEREQVIGGMLAGSVTGLGKPVCVLSYEARPDAVAHRWLRDAGAALIDAPDAGVLALKSWLDFKPAVLAREQSEAHAHDAARRARTQAWLAARVAAGRLVVLEDEAKTLLVPYGLAVPAEGVANDAEDAVHIAASLGYPVALKVLSTGMTHRGIGRGVLISLADAAAVRRAWNIIMDNMTGLADARVLVQRMAPRGSEFLLGALHDADVGTTLAISEGGAQAESGHDALFFSIPCARATLARRLDGWDPLQRTREPVDAAALLDAAVAVADFLADAAGWVDELDINPIILPAGGGAASAVDGLLVLRRPG